MRPVPCLYHYRLSSSSIYHTNVVAIDHRHAQMCRSNVSGVVHICSLLVHVAACSIYFWTVLPLLSSTNNRFDPSNDPVLLCSLLTAKHTLDYTCSLPKRPFCVRYSYCAVPPTLLYTPHMRSWHPIVVFWSSPFPLSSVRLVLLTICNSAYMRWQLQMSPRMDVSGSHKACARAVSSRSW
jgi:hypothetical protein